MNKKKKIKFGDVSLPPGGIKIAQALRALLEDKDFNSITTSEIAAASGMNEALIYRYFGNKRELLHSLMKEFHYQFYRDIQQGISGIKGSLNKIRKIIWEHIYIFERDPVYARILLLELGSYLGFYESSTYELFKEYTTLIKNIIQEGVETGEIRTDIPIWSIRQIVLGAIHYMCLPKVIQKKEIITDELTEDICNIIFNGIVRKNEQKSPF
jgi:TetR/AcrR family transcriptional regulator, fatty acid metabolism regulator protein